MQRRSRPVLSPMERKNIYKMKKLFTVLSLIILTTACSKEELPETPVSPEIPAPVVPEVPEEVEGFVLQPEDTRNHMADPAATAETASLFYNLKNISRESFIVGQQDAFNSFYGNTGG